MTAIREGIAANLLPLLEDEVVRQVSPWLLDNPSKPSLQVAGALSMVRPGFGDPSSLVMLIEAAVGVSASDQAILDVLLLGDGATPSVWDAVESDPRLTSRYNADDGLTTSQPAAVDDIAVIRYDQPQRFTFPNGVEAMLATWQVQVEFQP